jgi:transposase InsO family protein
VSADRFQMVDTFIGRQAGKKDGLSATQCLCMFGVSRSGYYSWAQRQKDTNGSRAAKQESRNELKEKFRKIVRKLGFVPGKRTFQTYMWRDFNISISVKRCRTLMREMNLVANKPKKDAYKHQATHDHEYASPENRVNQNFYVGPRKVILTDITYLYYGFARTPIYLCAFRDAYTKEILGHDIDIHMTVELVKNAYNAMMEQHGKELRGAQCVIHSDQGSQYLSTTFQALLTDDGFVQSVSGRGNSQDNAPMESFFGRMKCEMLDLIALCPDSETAKRMISGYIDAYNNEHYQYALAGLTPSEYYAYITTGIYPMDNYYGIKATELMPIGALVTARLNAAAAKNKKARASHARKKEAAQEIMKNPTMVVARDQRVLQREISKWTRSKKTAMLQVTHLKEVLEKVKQAQNYLLSAPAKLLKELSCGQSWSKYPELAYIYDMRELF